MPEQATGMYLCVSRKKGAKRQQIEAKAALIGLLACESGFSLGDSIEHQA